MDKVVSAFASIPPGFIMMLGALLIPFFKNKREQANIAIALPVIGFIQLLMISEGSTLGHLRVMGFDLTISRIDHLSMLFGYIFHIAAFLSALYAMHVKDTCQHIAGMIYAGSAIAAVFAGDMITLFVMWELTALSSVFFVWASRNESAIKAGLRYLVVQVGSGVLLLTGILIHLHHGGSLEFNDLMNGNRDIFSAGLGTQIIFLAFGIKCAFPLLHNWLQDSYPKATITGTVFLSAFTTKLAIYALCRGFPGTEFLITIGCIMTLFPIIFAVIENDLRTVLTYSLNNQLGFMCVGIGIGTELALNGAVAHAFSHIIYKGLLFMSVGAVLYRTGTCKASELGGLFRSMPLTGVCCMIGAAAISAFPLFSGFVAKGLIMAAVVQEQMPWAFIALLIASAGVFHHSGIKIPYFTFFAHDSKRRVKEAPKHMLAAMLLASALCIIIGIFPYTYYDLLPFSTGSHGQVVINGAFDVHKTHPWDISHILTQTQLLFFAALAFTLLIRTNNYPHEIKALNLDTDWIYRRGLPRLWQWGCGIGNRVWQQILDKLQALVLSVMNLATQWHRGDGALSRTWSVGVMAAWVIILLGIYLSMSFIR